MPMAARVAAEDFKSWHFDLLNYLGENYVSIQHNSITDKRMTHFSLKFLDFL